LKELFLFQTLKHVVSSKTERVSPFALYVREQLEFIELCLGADEEGVESLWVRIKGQPHMGDIIVGV